MSAFYTVTRKDKSGDFTLDIDKFIGDFGYGIYRSDRLVEEYPDNDDDLVVYDRKRIGRGISVSLQEYGFELQMLMPDTETDISLLFELIRRLSDQMGECVISDEEKEIFLSDIPEKTAELIDASRRSLVHFAKTDRPSGGCLSFYSAKYPLDFDKDMLDKIYTSSDPLKTFGDMLHELQSNPAARPAPAFFKTPSGAAGASALKRLTSFLSGSKNLKNSLKAAGVFTVNLGESLILPLKPSAPFGLRDENNDPLDVCAWYAVGYLPEERTVAGAAKYEDFISSVSGTACPFDGSNIVIQAISPEKAKEIFTGDKSMIFGNQEEE